MFKEFRKEIFNFGNLELTFQFVIILLVIIIKTISILFKIDFLNLDSYIDSLILFTLTLLSLGALKDRMSRRELLNATEGISSKLRSIAQVRDDYRETVTSILQHSHKSVGLVLRTAHIVGELEGEFQKVLDRRVKIEIIMCKQEEPIVESMEKLSEFSPEKISRRFEESEEAIKRLSAKYNKNFGVLITRKYIDVQPPFLMYISDRKMTKGKVFVVTFSFKSSPRIGPSILFNYKENVELFEYYQNQFDTMWEKAEG